MSDYPEFPETEAALDPLDDRLLALLSTCLDGEVTGEPLLSEATLDALERLAPELPVSPQLQARLSRTAKQAELDTLFLRSLHSRQRATLGGYLAFLRGRTAWTVSETAKRLRLDFQWLADLERDALPPRQIPARKLEQLIKRLKGSWEMTEQVLASTIQAPRYLSSTGRSSLYRKGNAASQGVWTVPPDTLTARENPEYLEQVEALEALREQLRNSWNS